MFILAILVVGVAVGAAISWLLSRKIKVTWYEWLIGAIGVLLLLFGIQNFIGSLAEVRTVAAYSFLGFFTLPAIILLALAARLIWSHQRSARLSQQG